MSGDLRAALAGAVTAALGHESSRTVDAVLEVLVVRREAPELTPPDGAELVMRAALVTRDSERLERMNLERELLAACQTASAEFRTDRILWRRAPVPMAGLAILEGRIWVVPS